MSYVISSDFIALKRSLCYLFSTGYLIGQFSTQGNRTRGVGMASENWVM